MVTALTRYDMTKSEFNQSLKSPSPPEACRGLIKAMWYFFNGDWEGAHDIAQDNPSPMGARIHGLLHWQEGDRWNAEYWYRRAGAPFPGGSIEEEAGAILQSLLAKPRAKR